MPSNAEEAKVLEDQIKSMLGLVISMEMVQHADKSSMEVGQIVAAQVFKIVDELTAEVARELKSVRKSLEALGTKNTALELHVAQAQADVRERDYRLGEMGEELAKLGEENAELKECNANAAKMITGV